MNLFGKETRPVWNQEMKELFLDQLSDKIIEWEPSYNKVDVIIDCRKVFGDVKSYNEDAYQLARTFETECQYDPDIDFVNIMDEVSYLRIIILNDKVRYWVKSDGIKPDKKVGESVKVNIAGKICTGQIIKVDEENAIYLVKTLEFDQNSYNGLSKIKFEDLL